MRRLVWMTILGAPISSFATSANGGPWGQLSATEKVSTLAGVLVVGVITTLVVDWWGKRRPEKTQEQIERAKRRENAVWVAFFLLVGLVIVATMVLNRAGSSEVTKYLLTGPVIAVIGSLPYFASGRKRPPIAGTLALLSTPYVLSAIVSHYIFPSPGTTWLFAFATNAVLASVALWGVVLGWGVVYGGQREGFTVHTMKMPAVFGEKTRIAIEHQEEIERTETRFDDVIEYHKRAAVISVCIVGAAFLFWLGVSFFK